MTQSPTSLNPWLTPRRFALLLVGLIIVSAPEVCLGWQSFFLRDFGYFGYPLAYYHREAFWRGEIPLWNPLSCSGLPFLAQWNTLALYPGSLLYLLLPLPWSLCLFCLAHQLLAGMGMYQLAHHWTGSRLGGAVAGMTYAFNGLTLNCLAWPNNIAALGWMPWLVLACDQAWRLGGRKALLAGLVGAIQMLTGAPEMILFTWVIVGALWLGRTGLSLRRPQGRAEPQIETPDAESGAPGLEESPVSWLVLVRRFAGVWLVVVGLSAVQLLPFLDLLAHSDRSQSYGTAFWSMPRWGWANLLLPLLGCYRSPLGVCFQAGQDWTSSYYLGVGTLALAIMAGALVRQWRVWCLGGLALAGLVLALGDEGHLYTWVRRLLPGSGYLRYPIKCVVLAGFALPLLAGWAVAMMQLAEHHPLRVRARRAAIVVGLCLLGLMGWLVWFGIASDLFYVPDLNPWSHALGRVAFLGGVLGLTFALTGAAGRRFGPVIALALLGTLWLDAFTHAPRQNPAVAPEVLAPDLLPGLGKLNPLPRPGGSRALVTRAAHDQVYQSMVTDAAKDYLCHRLWLFGNVNLLDHIPLVDGFYSLYLREQREVWARTFFHPRGQSPAALLDFLGVAQISNETNLFEWTARPRWLPLITAGRQPVFADPPATLHAIAAATFAPERDVFLPTSTRLETKATRGTQVMILDLTFDAHRIEAWVRAQEAAWVVVAQSFYHPWKAYVDGQPTRLWRANHAFQALEVPPGTHHVHLIYRDAAFHWGAAISLLTGLGVLGYCWRSGAGAVGNSSIHAQPLPSPQGAWNPDRNL